MQTAPENILQRHEGSKVDADVLGAHSIVLARLCFPEGNTPPLSSLPPSKIPSPVCVSFQRGTERDTIPKPDTAYMPKTRT